MPKYSQYNVPTVNECVNFGVGQPDTRKLPLDFLKEHYLTMVKIYKKQKFYNMDKLVVTTLLKNL